MRYKPITKETGLDAYCAAVGEHEKLGHKNVRRTFWDTWCRECEFKADLVVSKGNPFDLDDHRAEWGFWLNGKQVV